MRAASGFALRGRTRRRRPLIGVIATIAIVAGFLSLGWRVIERGALDQLASADSPSPSTYTVVDVVDGDTLDVTDAAGSAARVRILGIDTPEYDECGGSEATAQLSTVLHPGQQITLTRDDSQSASDQYGRVLAYVQLEDGTDVGRLLIETGYAQELTIGAEHARASDYAVTEEQARAERRGAWAICAPW